jgi:hypothetical protein
MLSKIEYLIKSESLKEEWKNKAKIFIENSIDTTAFLVWFIETYPTSAKVMKENPEYQYKFR